MQITILFTTLTTFLCLHVLCVSAPAHYVVVILNAGDQEHEAAHGASPAEPHADPLPHLLQGSAQDRHELPHAHCALGTQTLQVSPLRLLLCFPWKSQHPHQGQCADVCVMIRSNFCNFVLNESDFVLPLG